MEGKPVRAGKHGIGAQALWLAVLACAALCATPAHAWKPKTHIYIANVIRDDAQDGKVWIPPFGEFSISLEAQMAINAADYFRAGAVGPDGFPDMWTGQAFIHPNTGPWLRHLWASAGRAFPAVAEVASNPSLLDVIARHLAIETTLDNRVRVSNPTISIPYNFVLNEMVLDPGAQQAGMNPLIQHYVSLYWEKYKDKDDKVISMPASGAASKLTVRIYFEVPAPTWWT